MKKNLLIAAALLTIPLFSAEKMNISGQKKSEEVSFKDGIYTVRPQGKLRIQLYPKGGLQPVAAGSTVEISAEVSGSGNIHLGMHSYNGKRTWLRSDSGKMIRVDAEDTETVKSVVTVKHKDAAWGLPLISIYSGEVKVEKLSLKVLDGLNKDNMAEVKTLPGWSFNHAKAIKYSLENNLLSIVTGQGQMTEMMAAYQAASAGNKVQFSGKIAGKGEISIGIYLYNRRRVWQGTVWEQVKVDGEVNEFPVLTVATPAGKDEVTLIRPVIRINAASDLKIDGLNVEVIK